jgi:phage FluMu protein Com
VASSSWREPSPPTVELKAVRCQACRKLLGNFDQRGRAEIICPRCRVLNTIRPK